MPLPDDQSEEDRGKLAEPLVAWTLGLVTAELGVGLLLSPKNSRELLAAVRPGASRARISSLQDSPVPPDL